MSKIRLNERMPSAIGVTCGLLIPLGLVGILVIFGNDEIDKPIFFGYILGVFLVGYIFLLRKMLTKFHILILFQFLVYTVLFALAVDGFVTSSN